MTADAYLLVRALLAYCSMLLTLGLTHVYLPPANCGDEQVCLT
jgi:hypothetical protein